MIIIEIEKLKNQIFNEDCVGERGFKTIPSDSIDCCVIDPPYKLTSGGKKNTKVNGAISRRVNDLASDGTIFTYNNILPKDYFSEIYRVLKDGSHFYCMCNDKHLKSILNEGEKAGFKEVNILVWNKHMHTPTQYYMKNIEFIVLFRKGKAKYINNMGTFALIDIEGIRGNKVHPSEKPVDLFKLFIENSTKEGDIVLDCFMGAGCSALACLESNRNYIGYEIDKKYFDIIQNRIDTYIN